jgi:hypothetical protein
MKLPEAHRAVIAPAKIRDYFLSSSHPLGRFKVPFSPAWDIPAADCQRLEQDLLTIASSGDAEPGTKVRMAKSTKFVVLEWAVWEICNVLTAWIVRFESDVPQFVTAFPGEPE